MKTYDEATGMIKTFISNNIKMADDDQWQRDIQTAIAQIVCDKVKDANFNCKNYFACLGLSARIAEELRDNTGKEFSTLDEVCVEIRSISSFLSSEA